MHDFRISFSLYGGEIAVNPFFNRMRVHDQQKFDEAIKLAYMYEKRTGEKFKLKKNYCS